MSLFSEINNYKHFKFNSYVLFTRFCSYKKNVYFFHVHTRIMIWANDQRMFYYRGVYYEKPGKKLLA